MASIKCTDCQQVKPPQYFSNKQILQLKNLKAKNKNNKTFDPLTTGYIRCQDCSPQQVTELKCNWCDTWKDKGQFSGNERSKGTGVATCTKCVNEKSSIEPGARSDEDDGSEPEVESSDEDDESGKGATLPSK